MSWPHQLLLGLVMFMVTLVATCTLLPLGWALPEDPDSRITSPETAPTSSVRPSAPRPTPSPTAIPVARHSITGTASWCAPTPTRCQGWGGTARLGAVPTWAGRRYSARVCERLADTPARGASRYWW